MKIENSPYSPLQDKYSVARLFGKYLPRVYGERGDAVVRCYTNFRWVDNYIDESEDPIAVKLAFLERQRLVALTDESITDLDEYEVLIRSIYVDGLPKLDVEKYLCQMLDVFQLELESVDKVPTSYEARHMNWRTVVPSLQLLFCFLNGNPCVLTKEFLDFIDNWIVLANLRDLAEDAKVGKFRFSLSAQQRESISSGAEEKRLTYMRVFSKQEFNKIKWKALINIAQNPFAFSNIGLTGGQKLFMHLYVTRSLVKRALKTKYTS